MAYYSDWGTLRNTANMGFVSAVMGKHGSSTSSRQANICWARQQLRYMTGSLSGTTRSYVVGYGPSWPQRPHHRPSACAASYREPCVASGGGTCCAGESGEAAPAHMHARAWPHANVCTHCKATHACDKH